MMVISEVQALIVVVFSIVGGFGPVVTEFGRVCWLASIR